jgi:hypothetical protein
MTKGFGKVPKVGKEFFLNLDKASYNKRIGNSWA